MSARILIFGTVYADTEEKAALAQMWANLHKALNPDCDLLLVDSASPFQEWHAGIDVFDFGNNIGHLARGGRDGWGRAFCYGLDYAVANEYDYVAHIEGDSLCSLDIKHVCEWLSDSDPYWLSRPVIGTKKKEKDWVETGLMIFDAEYLMRENVTERYERTILKGKKPIYPENVFYHMIGEDGFYPNWLTMRDDCKQLNPLVAVSYQWITHCNFDVFKAFYKAHMPKPAKGALQ